VIPAAAQVGESGFNALESLGAVNLRPQLIKLLLVGQLHHRATPFDVPVWNTLNLLSSHGPTRALRR
jgi:hypothetical protein